MKRLSMLMMCMFAIMAASLSAKAQEITINLRPGWNWIGYPNAMSVELNNAFGDFIPMEGDVVKAEFAFAEYQNGNWVGSLTQFMPGKGYMYCSRRIEETSFVFRGSTPQSQVFVTTAEPTEITAISATCGGNVASGDGNYVSVLRGICWSLNPNPTFDDNYIEVGSGNGNFTISMTELSMNTTYYIRAFAVTDDGTIFGEQKTFTTKDGIPVLNTAPITNIGGRWVTSGGTIFDDGGLTVTERGVCWSTSPDPTIEDNHIVNGVGIGDFTSNIIGLNVCTTYYIRAYATNEVGTTYGNELDFTTQQTWQNGISPGAFSVSASQQVYFSQGNLQYIGSASTPYWKFAENQWDYLGTTTGQNSINANVDRDLFGWGTSGWDSGNTYYQPWDTDNSNSSLYGPPGQYNLTDSYANADWGVYNQICNGGNNTNMWRTLTLVEWRYIFNTRNTPSGIRYARAKVNNVNGVILLPDNWDNSIFNLQKTNNNSSFSDNIITVSQWSIIEQAGAVFLPVTGFRNGTSVNSYDSVGCYWSASYSTYGTPAACEVQFSNGNSILFLGAGSGAQPSRHSGYSVRLVRDAE